MVVPYTGSTAQYGHAQAHQYRSPHPSMEESRPLAPEFQQQQQQHQQQQQQQQQPSTVPTSTSYQAYPSPQLDPQTTENSVNSTTQHQSTNPPDVRSTYSSSGTPTSESSAIYSNRTPAYENHQVVLSNRFVEGSSRYQPTSSSSGGMARNVSKSNSPTVKAEREISEDSSGAAASPSTFAPPGHYPPQYPTAQHVMNEGYQQHPGTPNTQWRQQEWSPYGPPPHQMSNSPYGHSPSPTTMAGSPAMVSTARPVQGQKANRKRAGDPPPNHPLSQVYSFVPIPGATQTKRPRRRYEEIERMYKCGWSGCEKAYGTLNHLNAHVTMQGHGNKRTPDEFKEIRKEWKARKKDEENQRKAHEDEVRRRVDDPNAPPNPEAQQPIANSPYQSGGMSSQQRQLPLPLTYQQPNVSMAPNGVHYSPASAPPAPMENMQQYAPQPMYTGYGAAPPYTGQAPIFAGQQRSAPAQSNGNNSTAPGGEKPAENGGARV